MKETREEGKLKDKKKGSLGLNGFGCHILNPAGFSSLQTLQFSSDHGEEEEMTNMLKKEREEGRGNAKEVDRGSGRKGEEEQEKVEEGKCEG